jgi:hypothetical protein
MTQNCPKAPRWTKRKPQNVAKTLLQISPGPGKATRNLEVDALIANAERSKQVISLDVKSHVAYLQCQENQPACHNCLRTKVSCIYPVPRNLNPIQSPRSLSLEAQNLQSTPTIFNASDMRLFHHFIVTAYPHLPFGNDNVWVREIASFSHSVRSPSSLSHPNFTNLY